MGFEEVELEVKEVLKQINALEEQDINQKYVVIMREKILNLKKIEALEKTNFKQLGITTAEQKNIHLKGIYKFEDDQLDKEKKQKDMISHKLQSKKRELDLLMKMLDHENVKKAVDG